MQKLLMLMGPFNIQAHTYTHTQMDLNETLVHSQ